MPNNFFICNFCKKEIKHDVELIHGHYRSKHSERIIDIYSIAEIKKPENWIEKEE